MLVDPGLRPPTARNMNRLSWVTWCQAPPSQAPGSVPAFCAPLMSRFPTWISAMPSSQTCFHCEDESGWTLVASGRKKIPPPHIEPAKKPLAGA